MWKNLLHAATSRLLFCSWTVIVKCCYKVLITSLIIVTGTGVEALGQKNRQTDARKAVIYPKPPAETKIQYLTSFSTSADIEGKQSAFNRFVFGENNPLPIVKPYGITIHGNKAYICDTGIGGLVILDFKDKTFEYFIPTGRGDLIFPINCHLDDGILYVADGNRRQVVIFDSDLNYLNAITLEGRSKPTDVFVDGSSIWISAVDDHKIYRYNKDNLQLIKSFPDITEGSEGYLYQPANMNVWDSKIYVSDIGDCRVKVFDTQYEYLFSFGGPGKGFGEFTRPKGIAVDADGTIYVTDAAFENVQLFTPEGALLMYFGGTYTGPGGMWLPADVTIDYNNNEHFENYVAEGFQLQYLIFVTNQYGPDKISVYGFVGSMDKQ